MVGARCRAVLRAREGILEGEPLSISVGATNRFPVDLVAIMNSIKLHRFLTRLVIKTLVMRIKTYRNHVRLLGPHQLDPLGEAPGLYEVNVRTLHWTKL